jgi:Chaperone of endosialidase
VSNYWRKIMIDFPSSPALGQIFDTGSLSYEWNGVAWISISAGGGIPDAPDDGLSYARSDSAWVQVIPTTGGEFTGPINGPSINTTGTVSINAPHAVLTLNNSGAETDFAAIMSYTNNMLRWQSMIGDNSPETGGNAGTDIRFNRFDDTGEYLGSPLVLSRATGAILHEDGTVAAPALAFSSEPGLGFYRNTTGVINIASSGGVSASFDSTGETQTTTSFTSRTIGGTSTVNLGTAPPGSPDRNILQITQGVSGDASIATVAVGSAVRGNLTIDAPYVTVAGQLSVQTISQSNTAAETDIAPGPLAWPDLGGGMIAIRGNTNGNYPIVGPITCYSGTGNTGASLMDGATAWSVTSDERLKNIASEITDGIDAITAMRPIRFRYKFEKDTAPLRVGLTAQSIVANIPEAVSEESGIGADGHATGDLHYSLRITEVIPHLVSAIKTLNAEVEHLKTQLAAIHSALEKNND